MFSSSRILREAMKAIENTLSQQSGSRRHHVLVLLAIIFVMGMSPIAMRADTILLQGGEKVVGKIVSENDQNVVFQSRVLGIIRIPRDSVEKIEREPTLTAPLYRTTNSATGLSFTNTFVPWLAGPPGGDALDWIQLKSGEWLAGKLKSLQDEKLEFDSEELDVHVFDWKDIRTVRSPRLLSIRFETGKPLEGALLIISNEVRVVSETDTNVYPRRQLLAIAPTGSRELSKWSGKVSAGASYRAGNTKEVDFNTHAMLQRRTPTTRLSLDYLGNYGKVNGEETEDNHRFTGQFDYFLSRRLYVRVPDIEYYRDPLQNIAHRLTLGGGTGYDLIKSSRTEWDVTLGPAWQANWFDSVEPGEASYASSLAMVLSTRLDIELTKRLDFIAEYRGQLTSRETGNNTHHAVATLEFEVHKRLKMDLSFVWDRITSPMTESNGATPTPDDFRLITSLGVDF